MSKKLAVLSLSGGMDSSSLLLHLVAKGYHVTALSFNYGQKHSVELQRAKELVKYLKDNGIKKVKHQIIELKGLSKLLNSNLVKGGKDVPEGHYEQENMKDTVVPNRNKIFSSVIQSVALSQATDGKKKPVIIAMGLHAGDHAVYPDCRQEFRDADYDAFQIGNWDGDLVSYYTPYLAVNKFEILQDGLTACSVLGLDFDEVYKRTNTSYKPYPSGNSDYKSAASVERIEAFIKLNRSDSVQYEDETGPVGWEIAKSHVQKVLADYVK